MESQWLLSGVDVISYPWKSHYFRWKGMYHRLLGPKEEMAELIEDAPSTKTGSALLCPFMASGFGPDRDSEGMKKKQTDRHTEPWGQVVWALCQSIGSTPEMCLLCRTEWQSHCTPLDRVVLLHTSRVYDVQLDRGDRLNQSW